MLALAQAVGPERPVQGPEQERVLGPVLAVQPDGSRELVPERAQVVARAGVQLPERAQEPGQELVLVPERARARLPALGRALARALLPAREQALARERLPVQAQEQVPVLARALAPERALVLGRVQEPGLAQGPGPVLAWVRVLVQPVARVPGLVLRQQAQRHPLAGPQYIPQGW